MLNQVLPFLIYGLGIYAPPFLLALAWYSRLGRNEHALARHWRRTLRDVALIGTTLEGIAFWGIIFLAPIFTHHREGGTEDVMLAWIPISFYCSIILAILAGVANGKGRVLTIFCCVFLFFGFVAVDAMR